MFLESSLLSGGDPLGWMLDVILGSLAFYLVQLTGFGDRSRLLSPF